MIQSKIIFQSYFPSFKDFIEIVRLFFASVSINGLN